MDRVQIAATHDDFEAYLDLAARHGAGLEIQTFAHPDALDNGGPALVAEYRRRLAGFAGLISMHGAFFDLVSASPDPKVVAVAENRYRRNIEIAAELGARVVVFHLNFLTQIRNPEFRVEWTRRQVEFWVRQAEFAGPSGVVLALENMWEHDPAIVGDVIRGVNSPYVKACLDVGHAHLFSEHPVETWLRVLGDDLIYTHLNNNGGQIDQHRALDDGVMDIPHILTLLRCHPNPPVLALESAGVEAMRRSLPYLALPHPDR